MTKENQNKPYQIIWLVRRLFRALSNKANENLEGMGITVADRAVMEFLYPDKTLSVPEIAELYKVSRQHIQQTVNSLLDVGLVKTKENPRHKRSPLIMLNAKGRELFGDIKKKEEEIIKVLFADISRDNIKVTQNTLQSLLNELT